MLVSLINYLTYFMARIRIEDFQGERGAIFGIEKHGFYTASCERGIKPPCIFAWFIRAIYTRKNKTRLT